MRQIICMNSVFWVTAPVCSTSASPCNPDITTRCRRRPTEAKRGAAWTFSPGEVGWTHVCLSFLLRSSEAYWSTGRKPAVKKRWGSLFLFVFERDVCVNCLCCNSLCCRAGDVSRGAGGDPGRHRTNTVRQDPGAALQTDLQMCLQPTLPGQNQTSGF